MSQSTLQTNYGHLICPVTRQFLVDPVQIIIPVMGVNGVPVYQPYHFEKSAIEQILATGGVLPYFNVQITAQHVGAPAPELVSALQQFRAAQSATPLPSVQTTTPQLVPVYQPSGALQPSSVTRSSAPAITGTAKNPPKKEEGFLATFFGVFSSDRSTQTATVTTQAPSQQATATTSALATTRGEAKDRILLSVSEDGTKIWATVPTLLMRQLLFNRMGAISVDAINRKFLLAAANRSKNNEAGLPTICSLGKPEALQLLIQLLELKENNMIKFGRDQSGQVTQLFLSHPRFFSDPKASLKIRIPQWLQQEAAAAPQLATTPRR